MTATATPIPSPATLSRHIGANLRRRRAVRRLTQQELADAAGCHRVTVARIETGELTPRWPLLLALATALACDLRQLLRPRADRKKSASPRRPA